MSFLINSYSVAAVSSYIGPGDVLPLTSFWGVRAYNGAYAGSGGAALDLRRASDNGTMTSNSAGLAGSGVASANVRSPSTVGLSSRRPAGCNTET